MKNKFLEILLSKKLFYILIFIIAAVSIIFLIQTYGKAYRDSGYDFTSYLLSSKALISSANPYDTNTSFHYVYTLTLAFLLIPLTFLPYWLSNLIWFVLNFSAFFYTIYILWNLLSERTDKYNKNKFTLFLFLTFILVVNIIQNNLLNGQINIIILVLCILFYKSHLNEKIFWQVFYLSLAISLKLTPLILIVYLIIKKKYSIAIYSLLLSLVFIFLPYLIVGNQIVYYYSYYIDLLTPLSNTSIQMEGFNLYTLIQKVFFFIPFFNTTNKIVESVVVFSLFILFYVLNKYIIIGNIYSSTLYFCMYLLGILLLSPISEIHHLILILPTIFTLLIIIQYYEKAEIRTTLISSFVFMLFFIVGFIMGSNLLFLFSILTLFITSFYFIKTIYKVENKINS